MGKFRIIADKDKVIADKCVDFRGMTPAEAADIYKKWLQEDYEKNKKMIELPSALLPGEKTSDNFSLYTAVERSIMEFIGKHEDIEDICMVCPDEDIMTFGMVVFNYWFSTSKDERLNNGKWD